MMKETNFGPLLLLLLIALTPRNSSANPIASPDDMMDGADAHLSGPTVDGTTEGAHASMPIAEDMKERTNKLAIFMTLLQDNKLSSQFDESILDLEKNILNLSYRLLNNRDEILTELYTSQTRITILRSLLKIAASTLIEHCNTLLEMYNNDDGSVEVIAFSASQFVLYANEVKDTLQEALDITIDIDDKLAAAEALLKVLNDTLEEETTDFKASQEAAAAEDIPRLETDLENEKKAMEKMLDEDGQYTNKVTIISCIFTVGFECTIKLFIFENQNIQNAREVAVADRMKLESQFELQKVRKEEIDKRCKLLNDIKSAQQSATTLLSHVKDVQQYLVTEIDLIIKWKGPLATAITENTNITSINIKFNIKGIKKSLNNLKNACYAYLGHKLPDVLKSRESLITSGG